MSSDMSGANFCNDIQEKIFHDDFLPKTFLAFTVITVL